MSNQRDLSVLARGSRDADHWLGLLLPTIPLARFARDDRLEIWIFVNRLLKIVFKTHLINVADRVKAREVGWIRSLLPENCPFANAMFPFSWVKKQIENTLSRRERKLPN